MISHLLVHDLRKMSGVTFIKCELWLFLYGGIWGKFAILPLYFPTKTLIIFLREKEVYRSSELKRGPWRFSHPDEETEDQRGQWIYLRSHSNLIVEARPESIHRSQNRFSPNIHSFIKNLANAYLEIRWIQCSPCLQGDREGNQGWYCNQWTYGGEKTQGLWEHRGGRTKPRQGRRESFQEAPWRRRY